jgi:hypothetical protein
VPAEQLRANGELMIEGDAHAAGALLDALRAPELLDGLRRRYEASRARA